MDFYPTKARLMNTMRLPIRSRRLLSTSIPRSTQRAQDGPAPLRFYGNTGTSASSHERMREVFGGRVEGGGRVASSRREAGESRLIGGVLVPDRPKEPDNCCMSGCVNCVWEQYNDDIRDWRKKRTMAAESLNKTDEKWPADFHPPLKQLEFKNVPKELRAMKRKMDSAKKLSSSAYFPTNGKPGAQNLKKQEEPHNDDEDDDWGNVPVQFKVFAETEKLMKQKKLQKQREKEQAKQKETKA